MSFTLKSLLAVSLFTLVAACAQQDEAPMEEPMVMEADEPMSKY